MRATDPNQAVEHFTESRRWPYRQLQLHMIRDHDASVPGPVRSTPRRALDRAHEALPHDGAEGKSI